ncbi:MAG: alpha/beta hydrolase [Acidobacteria bacterium]|nr:alpha/beta hydrolase [Acidobacteriota bacterium]MBK8146975.1 alpha/beta hydrolase [Acidobacteriota bacterium]
MQLQTKEVRIPAADAVLAGTLLAPPTAGPRPGLLLVSGSGANDRDETVCGHTPFRTIAEYFAGCGYVVLRCDDRGVGGSTGDAGEQDFDGAVADVVAAYRWLAGHPAVDSERIALLGHSEGGLIAAVAGKRVGAWAVVMLAGPSVPIEWLLHEQARTISAEAGATAVQIEHERRMNERVFALARSLSDQAAVQMELEGVIRAYLRSWPDAAELDEATVGDNARIMAGVVNAPAFRSLLRQEPAIILGRFGGPLLAVYGGKDTQVPGVANADAFREITTGYRCASVMLFPDHNHLFQRAGTGAISEYESLPPGPDAAVLRAVADWLSTAEPGAAPARRGMQRFWNV